MASMLLPPNNMKVETTGPMFEAWQLGWISLSNYREKETGRFPKASQTTNVAELVSYRLSKRLSQRLRCRMIQEDI